MVDIRKHWRLIFVAFVVAAAVWKRQEAARILDAVIHVPPWVFLAALALELTELGLQAARMWIIFKKPMRKTAITYTEGLAASLAALSRAVGEGIRVGITSAELHVPGESAGAYVIMERIADVSVLTITAATFLPKTAFYIIVAAVLAGLASLEIPAMEKLLRKLPNWIYNTYAEAQQIARRRIAYLTLLILTVLLWCIDYSRLWIILWAMGAHISWVVVAGAVATSYLVSAITFIPGGLGIYEGGVAAILRKMGVPLSTGLAAVFYERVFSYWLILALGGIVGARREKE